MFTYLTCPRVQNFFQRFQKIRTCFKFQAEQVVVQREVVGLNPGQTMCCLCCDIYKWLVILVSSDKCKDQNPQALFYRSAFTVLILLGHRRTHTAVHKKQEAQTSVVQYNRIPVTRTLYNSNLPLTRSNLHFPSDRFLYNFTLDNSNSR